MWWLISLVWKIQLWIMVRFLLLIQLIPKLSSPVSHHRGTFLGQVFYVCFLHLGFISYVIEVSLSYNSKLIPRFQSPNIHLNLQVCSKWAKILSRNNQKFLWEISYNDNHGIGKFYFKPGTGRYWDNLFQRKILLIAKVFNSE